MRPFAFAVQLVDAAIGSTEAALAKYVADFIKQQVEKARAQIEEYSGRWGWLGWGRSHVTSVPVPGSINVVC